MARHAHRFAALMPATSLGARISVALREPHCERSQTHSRRLWKRERFSTRASFMFVGSANVLRKPRGCCFHGWKYWAIERQERLERRQRHVAFRSPSSKTGRPSLSMELSDEVLTALIVGGLGTIAGIGLLAFTEVQGERGKARGRREPCVECRGDGQVACGYCQGRGKLGFGQYEKECSYCKGRSTVVCLNCGGSGLQPRYLDRIRPEDLMD